MTSRSPGRSSPRTVPPVTLAVALSALVFLSTACGGNGTGTSPPPEPTRRPTSDELAASRNAPIPGFSQPTEISNPYFPLTDLGGYELVGREDGKRYRAQIVVLDKVKTIVWAGGRTDALVARHRSYLKGELIEVAMDYYAQGDDGSVWYFGEDVTYYEDGRVTNHEGSWLTGHDHALPGLLIPADRRVGLVFWSEDVADQGIQERNKIIDIAATVVTPNGRRDDGLLIRAWQDDGTVEEKIYVPSLGVVHEVGPSSELRLRPGN